ncbi:hypothetical protein GGTG_01711 [Gaeumannomyces tritici R3-111a-1]|uniref:Uncharacterized protein n=1 Tax=Gaeumannomyces tritici (strain R3-111a-1) TaxID=644352 RepID=J3NKD2_GAET3|nr:hypothetical protein GGTG_01711 [Gaeumannomyces tritici R3-111a-1]EJT81736.1 hypothetical protein GGTG_01711 [Gaeumannomyces tritici R3-111a-1]
MPFDARTPRLSTSCVAVTREPPRPCLSADLRRSAAAVRDSESAGEASVASASVACRRRRVRRGCCRGKNAAFTRSFKGQIKEQEHQQPGAATAIGSERMTAAGCKLLFHASPTTEGETCVAETQSF